jgi:hypothetical protein
MPDTRLIHLCTRAWQIYDADTDNVRLDAHRETCGECTKNYHNRHPMSISVDKSEER